MGILDRLFGSKPTPEERQAVIDYLTAEWSLRARQDDEASEFNSSTSRWGSSVTTDPDAARKVAGAAARMAAFNRTLIAEHGDLGPIPDAAGECYFAWHQAYLTLGKWSALTADSFGEIAAAADKYFKGQFREVADRTLALVGTQAAEFLSEEGKARARAVKAEGRLMKRCRISAEEGRRIMAEAEANAARTQAAPLGPVAPPPETTPPSEATPPISEPVTSNPPSGERYCAGCHRFLAAGTSTCGYCGHAN